MADVEREGLQFRLPYPKAVIAKKLKQHRLMRRVYLAFALMALACIATPIVSWAKVIAAIVLAFCAYCLYLETRHIRSWNRLVPFD
jgi:hypothetical protein